METLRGSSAEALAALDGELAGALDSGADAARLGDDLFTTASLLRAEAGLRRVATDASVPAEAKQALVRDLLGGKLGDAALDLVASAAGRRWTRARDLADTLEHLSEVSIVRSAASGGHGDSARLSDELFAYSRAVNDNPGLRDALSDPVRSTADKSALVRGLLDGKALPATLALAQQALAGTYRTVGVALTAYQQVAAAVHDEKVATVRVARPLADDDRRRLTEALSRSYGREIHLNVVVDPAVIGGIRVEIGDEVIDGTVATRLDAARRKLAG